MRRILHLILFCTLSTLAQAQYTFQNTSLSEALITLDNSTKRYDISFVYNELEDFTVSKTIKRGRSLPEAVREVCGFYPVKVSVKGRDILVECIQKDRTKLMGRLIGPDRQPVAYANIVLYNPSDSVLMDGGVSNEAGDFVIPCSATHARVRISCVGFKTIERQMPVANVGTIRMQMENNYLSNITVSGTTPIIRNEADRLQYIVSNDEYAKGLTALELLHRVPMVSLVNGRATILGKGTAHYMINGRVMEMDDEVIHQRLWSMHAEDIERIEVITMPTGRYLTDLGGGYINIVLNCDQNLGWRSDLSVQAGASDKWSARTDASVNYASEKFDMALDINGSWLTKSEDKDVHQSIGYLDRTYTSYKETEDKDLGANLMLRYLPEKNIEIGVFASYQHLWPKSDILSDIIQSHQLYTDPKYIYSESTLKYAGNHAVNLSTYFDWTLGKPDRKLSFSYNYYLKQDNHESVVFSEKRDSFRTHLLAMFTNESTYRIHSARLDLFMPLSSATILNAGLSYSNINNKAITVNEELTTYAVESRNILNNNCYEERLLASYLSMQQHFSKKLKAVAALRYEHTRTKSSQQRDEIKRHFYPTISLNYRSDGGGQIGAAWAMSVIRPNFSDLNPLIVYDSYYDRSHGNPFLAPSYENRLEVNYTSKKGLYANFYYIHGKDQIDWLTFFLQDYNSTEPYNYYKSEKTGLYVNFHHPLSNRMNVIAEGDLFYYDAKRTLCVDPLSSPTAFFSWDFCGIPEKVHGWGKRFAVSGDMFLNRQHSLLLNARYDQWLDDYIGMSKVDAYGYFTFALRYSLLNDRLKLSLTAVDPFHQHITDKSTLYNGSGIAMIHTHQHSHYLGLTATYSMGGKKVRQIHHEMKDDEIKRANAK
jgi:outer membrane receptor protein involved in Fe transport